MTNENFFVPSDETKTFTGAKLNAENNFVFNVLTAGEHIEIIKISKEGFFYKGEKIDDVHNVYERFHEWLKEAEITK